MPVLPKADPPISPLTQAGPVAPRQPRVPPAPAMPALLPSVSSAPAKEVLPTLSPARRDPILPPLLEHEAWHEWLLSVELNGQVVSQGGLFVEAPQVGSRPQLALLEAWRLKVDTARIVTFRGEPYYPLSAIAGATFELDAEGSGARAGDPARGVRELQLGGRRDRNPAAGGRAPAPFSTTICSTRPATGSIRA